MPINLGSLCLPLDATIQAAISQIDKNGKAIVLVTDAEHHLIGTVSDGDIRRAILNGLKMETPLREILDRKHSTIYPKPVTAQVGTTITELINIMKERVVHQIPIMDQDERVVDLVTWEDLLPEQKLPLQAVIMAGGFGTRMRPLTENLPKPMLPVDGKPLMELIVERLRNVGIKQVNVTTHYKPEKIIEHFGNGSKFGVNLTYVHEDQPLGTGGGLGLMTPPENTILVVNGDILTQVDFRAMLIFHQEHKAMMTVAVNQFGFKVPYGVVQCEGEIVKDLLEKPQYNFFVNAGIYLLEPQVFRYISNRKKFNMTDLIQWLIKADEKVVSFPILEYWMDIGERSEYEKAKNDSKARKKSHDLKK